jgi:hypothetical protein
MPEELGFLKYLREAKVRKPRQPGYKPVRLMFENMGSGYELGFSITCARGFSA